MKKTGLNGYIYNFNVDYDVIAVDDIYIYITFYSYFKESFGDEYHMYQLIPLHSCDYLNKISIKTNVATDEGNSRNEM